MRTHKPTLSVAQTVKNLPAMQETQIQSLGREDPLEKGMATHSSIPAWRIPRTEEPGGLQSVGRQRVRHDWATNTTRVHDMFLPCYVFILIINHHHLLRFFLLLLLLLLLFCTGNCSVGTVGPPWFQTQGSCLRGAHCRTQQKVTRWWSKWPHRGGSKKETAVAWDSRETCTEEVGLKEGLGGLASILIWKGLGLPLWSSD